MINSYPFYPQYYSPPPPFYPQNINHKSFRNNYSNSQSSNKTNNMNIKNTSKYFVNTSKRVQANLHKSMPCTKQDKSKKESNFPIDTKYDETIMFEFFGIKLHQDDILLIFLIFFLYSEGIKDEFLFIALILLLLS